MQRSALNNFLWKIVGISTEHVLVLKDFTNFVKSQGPFSNTPQMKNLDLFQHDWWDLIGTNGHTLAPTTHHILVQVFSTSSCKWNWSSYSFLHSKVQSRLTSNWAKKLVYIYINIKLLLEWLGTNPTTWYEKNMFKDSMSNVDESANKIKSLGEDPIVSNEFDEDEVKHENLWIP